MIDTSMVADVIWDKVLVETARQKIASLMGLSVQDAKKWVCFLAALHDLGKATPSFQMLSPDAKRLLGADGYSFRGAMKQYHGDLSACLLKTPLLKRAGIEGIDETTMFYFQMILGGHHGIYPASKRLRLIPPEDLGEGQWDVWRGEAITDLLSILQLPQGCSPSCGQESGAPFVLLSGLISVSDWIASAVSYFPYEQELGDVQKYAQISRERAVSALEDLRWTSVGNSEDRTLTEMFDFIKKPYPLQQAAMDLAPTLTSPGLIIIEAPMGEGKTEAALFLTERWNHNLGKVGAYIALPTQATANQMFHRTLEFMRNSSYGRSSNLSLVHGHASLSDSYIQLRVRGSEEEDVSATEWFDFKRRGVLSPFGVGTIDQALLSVIPTKYFFVRLFGLAGKTVIIDEAHAYDMYTSTILDKLIEWLSALGCCIIVLSATLTDCRCQELLKMQSGKEIQLEDRYPRISWASNSEGCLCFPSASSSGDRQNAAIDLKWLNDDASELAEALAEKLVDGGRVAIICNTVRRAQSLYMHLNTLLSGKDIHLDLFHARYMHKDRQRIETECIERYGKNGATSGKYVLIATQVIEQSLDLDFDLLISDIAPMDLLLQRAGRLHRHRRPRPGTLTKPELWLINTGEEGSFGPMERIYSRYTLLKTYLILKERDHLGLPDDIKVLIEDAYSIQSDERFPSMIMELRSARKEMEEINNKKIGDAYTELLPHPKNSKFWEYSRNIREEDDPEAHPSIQARTRLGPPSINGIVLFHSGDHLFLDYGLEEPVDVEQIDNSTIGRLLKNEVSLTGFRLVSALLQTPPPSKWGSRALLRHQRSIIFDKKMANEGGPRWESQAGDVLLVADEKRGIVEVVD